MFYPIKAKEILNLTNVEEIKDDMLINGTIETLILVDEEFLNYKSGIFVCNPKSRKIGSIPVRIIGWG